MNFQTWRYSSTVDTVTNFPNLTFTLHLHLTWTSMLKPVQLEPFNSPVGPATPVTQGEPCISKLLLQLGDWLSFHTIVTMGFKMAYVCSGERGS